MGQEIVVPTEEGKGFEVKVNGDTAVITLDKDLYKNNLPEGLDIATVKQVEEYNARFIKSITEAGAKANTAIMEKDANVNTVDLHAPFGAHTEAKEDGTYKFGGLHVHAERSRTHRIPGTDKTSTKSVLQVKATNYLERGLDIVGGPTGKFISDLKDDMTKKLLG